MEGESPRAFLERPFLTQRQKEKVCEALASLSGDPEPPSSRQVGSQPERVSPVFQFVPREGRELFICIDRDHYLYVPYVVHHRDKKVVICKIVARGGTAPTDALDCS
jgi:hypothetical protein